MVLDLSEILDISEKGMCIQTASPLPPNLSLPVVLDLAETKAYLRTTGTVVWSDSAGRTGISFPDLPTEPRQQLKEWLFANAIAACVNHVEASAPSMEDEMLDRAGRFNHSAFASDEEFEQPVRPDYTSILIALAAVKREVDSTGRDLEKALRLIADRALTFTRASGAAIALAEKSSNGEILCRGRAGSDAPPLGTRLDLGPSFSGECFRTGKLLRCEDSETDLLVDRESCELLGIRSMIAVPVYNEGAVVGLLEVFSPQPRAFIANDDMVLQRLAEMIASAIRNATSAPPVKSAAVQASPARVSPPKEKLPVISDLSKSVSAKLASLNSNRASSESVAGTPAPAPAIRTEDSPVQLLAAPSKPWVGRVLLIASAATLIVALMWVATPWARSWVKALTPVRSQPQPKSTPPIVKAPAPSPLPVTDAISMQQLAEQGDPAAQYAMGAKYSTGEDVLQDYTQALSWFSKAAEQGNVAAQATLGAYYWAGRGVPQDLSKAYYWAILAEAGGDEGSKYRVALLASRLSRTQMLTEQKRAEDWIKLHQSFAKSNARPAR
jgi:hypothetical protein